jgi:hypothetical protein
MSEDLRYPALAAGTRLDETLSQVLGAEYARRRQRATIQLSIRGDR